MSDDNGGTLINPPNKLGSKVTIGGPGAVDEATLARAEQVITDMADSYLDWVKEDLIKLQSAFDALKTGGADSAAGLDAIFQVAHDIKGQGGSFDYNLMTIIANQLCRFIEGLEGKSGPAEVEVIELHVNALQVVIAQALKGDGGAVGEQLLSGLEQVIAKRAGA